MADKLSRRKIAQHVATEFESGVKLAKLLEEVAAYLIDSRRTREARLVVRAIEEAFADRGVVIAEVTSARPLDADMKQAIASVVNAKDLHIREVIDPSVVGGVRIETPGEKMDSTIKRKLTMLREAKI